jgi:CDP-diacylglycerol--serine O-phosphatidyltransferase
MVSTIRFPSFKKRSTSPRAAMVTSFAIVLVFALMILFQQRFFVGFFAAYIVFALAMNVAWKAGWRGIEPPHDGREDPEIVH